MRCTICHHAELNAGYATVTLERGETTLIIKDVPARVCGNCGEEYVDEEITRQLLVQAEAASVDGVKVQVRSFAA